MVQEYRAEDKEMQVRYRDASELTGEPALREFAEISIPVPWGHLAGKWFGPQNVQPILGLHGWMDNAGTYDPLAALLPPHIALLSIDLPGHGLSTRLPDGCFYNVLDYLHLIRLIMKQYRWEKVSLMGHSMSSIVCFLFAAVFPERVHLCIALDALKPHVRDIPRVIRTLEKRIDGFLLEDERNRSQMEPPSYTYEELNERLYTGSYYSINKALCKHLLARNVQKSQKYPDKYYFCRDRRLQFYNYYVGSQELSIEMTKHIKCPYLFIKGRQSPYFEDKRYYDQVLELMQQKQHFEYVVVEGTHHFHMNNAESIVGPISQFLERYGATPKLKAAPPPSITISKL